MEDTIFSNLPVVHEDVIDELMKSYGQDILQLVYTYVHHHVIAEDLTQEIFLKCYQSLHTYKGNAQLKTWLWRIAINHTKDYLKSWYSRNVETIDDMYLHQTQAPKTVEQQVLQRSEEAQLAEAVMALPVKYREVIYLFYFEERTIKEIASLLEVNENTIKTRMRKGKQLLSELLGGL